jgi:glycerophosphoryl diester phosphodiesterase
MGFPIELDVRLLADGKVAVFHDEDTHRMTGSRHFIRGLRSRELKRFGLLGTVHRIPLLDEVLDAVNGEAPLLIDLKPSENGGLLGEAVLKTLDGYGGEHALQSFDPKVVLWLRRNAPNAPRGQLAGDLGAEGVRPWKSFLVERRLAARASPCSDGPCARTRRKKRYALSATTSSSRGTCRRGLHFYRKSYEDINDE